MQLAPNVLHHIISHLTHVSHVLKVPINVHHLPFYHAILDIFMIHKHTAVENVKQIVNHVLILQNV